MPECEENWIEGLQLHEYEPFVSISYVDDDKVARIRLAVVEVQLIDQLQTVGDEEVTHNTVTCNSK